MEKPLTIYDETEYVKQKVTPFIDGLKKICDETDALLFFTIAVKNSEKETVYLSSIDQPDRRMIRQMADKKGLRDKDIEKVEIALKQVRDACGIKNIPCFLVCYMFTKNGMICKNEGIFTGGRSITLFDDRIVKHLLIEAGFDAKLPEQKMEMDFSDI